ncbi:MAG TPA: ornithine carbamoyltransferase [Candidatus Sulfotelmatobacter sp.]|nr:ornithine carbamoyltransferase [Candidatus Sulfotelmatobacter sp.]
MTKTPRHFVDLQQLDGGTLRGILDRAAAMKRARPRFGKAWPDTGKPLAGKLLVMIFDRPSTRTRVSFDVAMRQLGGESIVLNTADLQLGRGETIADTARVLSRYADAIMLRTSQPSRLDELVQAANVPVINGLTNDSHPCQLMADVMTFEEHRGPIAGKVVAWVGDGNNVASTWIQAAVRFDFELRLACPEALQPPRKVLDWARAEGGRIKLGAAPEAAVEGADGVVTDVWVSMGQDAGDRHNLLMPYQVNERLMAAARPDAVFLHCLPAHRGEEVTAAVIDGPQSVVLDEAENRLHAQKGILTWCLGG